jgi:lipopolysaccharide/colanic/teichoic acid biosynthesis glycosyltransferase
MSLVGPRPVTQAEVEGPYTVYGAREHYLAVRPGMTGAWQVSGRSDTSYETRIRLDSDYVRNISFSRDIAILCRTVSVVLGCRGAY